MIEPYTPEKNGEYMQLSYSDDPNDIIGTRKYANNSGEQSITKRLDYIVRIRTIVLAQESMLIIVR